MIRLLTILLLTGCSAARISTAHTVILDGSKSHAADGQQLVKVQWRDINGSAIITNPSSLVTKAIVSKSTTFELWGQQTDGESAKDSMNVTIK